MRWRRATLPTTQDPTTQEPPALSLNDRRARAMKRAHALMATSIPTRDILASYLDDILTAP